MRHLTVGVFHDEPLAAELGKKGTLSDIAMFNRKTDDVIFTFMAPVEDKLTAKSQIVSTIDAAVVVFSQMKRELGETILMLDLMSVTQGIAITSPYATADQIAGVIGRTSIKSYSLQDRDPGKLLESLKGINPQRDTNSQSVIIVDHSFSVRGVGEVVLGFVKKGVVKKYDKLSLLPGGKEVLIRSIQVQDEDWDQAEAGTRVGLAIKGATLEELGRGSILTASNQVTATSSFKLPFSRNSFYTDELRTGPFHATVGMQSEPVTVSNVEGSTISIESLKPVAHEPRETLLLLDLNAKRTRIVGKGQFEGSV